jgi:hypothetical protein
LLVRTQQGISDGRPDVVEDALPYLVNQTADGVSAVTITVRASRFEPPDQGGTAPIEDKATVHLSGLRWLLWPVVTMSGATTGI